jgi:hypothetical protein
MADSNTPPQRTPEQQADELIDVIKSHSSTTNPEWIARFRRTLLDGEARERGFIAEVRNYYNAYYRLEYSRRAHRITPAGSQGDGYLDLDANPTIADVRRHTGVLSQEANMNIRQWEENEARSDREWRNQGGTNSRDGTRAEVVKLLREDPKAKELADKLKTSKNPKDFANLVAYLETKIDKFKYDLPGWEGNHFFGGNIVKTNRYTQDGCYGEALQIREIVGALRDENILPEARSFVANGGIHSALVVCLDNNSSGFIIDGWLARTGEAAPVFEGSLKSWYDHALRTANQMSTDVERERTAFWTASKLQTSPTQRTHDDGFLSAWVEARKRTDPTYSNSVLTDKDGATAEGHQDFIVAYYFLGDNPRLPGSEMRQDYFESLRDRIAHVVERDGANRQANTAAGLDIEKIKNAKNFDELKPQLEIFYRRYGVMPTQQARVSMGRQQPLSDIVDSAIVRLGLRDAPVSAPTPQTTFSPTILAMNRGIGHERGYGV